MLPPRTPSTIALRKQRLYPQPRRVRQLPGNDFRLFDSTLLLVNHFDGEGEWLDTSISTTPHEVKLCADAFESVWELGVPHSDYRIV